ncbi:hypothetical protein AMATHDRAFT_71805 [Amanita thiersii Skay4041]|uniref:Cap64 protein n=1 Tax=Amanita thiersii Skay4041 TaxID=703135 RepID=A0A2A9NAS5_9AGAR|nr:hypothetical protein AMATHDRAFT_71805 [Amanita thiersii Skay4041]
MYRRGKNALRIASPGQSPSISGSDSEKPSRLNQRTLFGVTNRIWLIVSLFLFLILFTHYILLAAHPGSGDHHYPAYSNADLKPKNYLSPLSSTHHKNNDDGSAPTEGDALKLENPFTFCPVYGPGDAVGQKYGQVVLGQSRMHLGSGARIQRLLNRALAGQPITISVIGGSISACHGAGDDPVSSRCYPSRFFQWWNTVFPHPASELTNGAMRRTNSGYFGFCSAHHIPDHTDLIIIELDTEDAPDAETMEHFETLIRSLLLRSDEPAVLLLGHFSPQIYQAHGYAGPDHWHNVVARFYDIPHLSTKPIHLPSYLRDPTSIHKFFVDPILASPQGHEVIADVLIAYFQTQACIAWDVANGQSFDAVPLLTPGLFNEIAGQGDGHALFGGIGQRKGVPEQEEDEDEEGGVGAGGGDKSKQEEQKRNPHLVLNPQQYQSLRVPSGRINTRPNNPSSPSSSSSNRKFEEIAPYCVSANNLINPLPPSLFYGSGWHSFHPAGASGGVGAGSVLKTSEHYWYSTLPTSKLRVPIQVGAGDIGVYYLKEPVGVVGEGSAVECWVDDNYRGAKVMENAADVGEAVPMLEMIDHYVTRGSHFVECQLLGEEGQGVPMFKIMGIFST